MFFLRKSRALSFFYASDVHGSERCWLKFLNAGKFYGVPLIIMGGDLTGKVLTPLVEGPSGTWTAQFMGRTEAVSAAAELAELEKLIRFNGFYPYRCSPEELQRLAADRAYFDQAFSRVMTLEMARWVDLAEQRLRGSGVRCLVMAGNDDERAIEPVLRGSDLVECHDEAVVAVDEFQVMGNGWAGPTPWNSPRELSETDLEAMLRATAARLQPGVPVILNAHCPPHASTLDDAPELTPDLMPVTTGGQVNLVPVGSTAVRRIIEELQPVVSLHGHIHESRAAARIGRTLCINPGSEYNQGVLRGVLVTVSREKVQSHQWVTG